MKVCWYETNLHGVNFFFHTTWCEDNFGCEKALIFWKFCFHTMWCELNLSFFFMLCVTTVVSNNSPWRFGVYVRKHPDADFLHLSTSLYPLVNFYVDTRTHSLSHTRCKLTYAHAAQTHTHIHTHTHTHTQVLSSNDNALPNESPVVALVPEITAIKGSALTFTGVFFVFFVFLLVPEITVIKGSALTFTGG
jgi:hypothetical protein